MCQRSHEGNLSKPNTPKGTGSALSFRNKYGWRPTVKRVNAECPIQLFWFLSHCSSLNILCLSPFTLWCEWLTAHAVSPGIYMKFKPWFLPLFNRRTQTSAVKPQASSVLLTLATSSRVIRRWHHKAQSTLCLSSISYFLNYINNAWVHPPYKLFKFYTCV